MSTPVTKISGLGPALASVLAQHGLQSVEDIASSDVKSLSAVPGFGPVKAGAILTAANQLLAPDQEEPKKSKAPKEKKKPKSKDKKKKKKGGKKKKDKKKSKKSGKKRKSKKGSKKKKKK